MKQNHVEHNDMEQDAGAGILGLLQKLQCQTKEKQIHCILVHTNKSEIKYFPGVNVLQIILITQKKYMKFSYFIT